MNQLRNHLFDLVLSNGLRLQARCSLNHPNQLSRLFNSLLVKQFITVRFVSKFNINAKRIRNRGNICKRRVLYALLKDRF